MKKKVRRAASAVIFLLIGLTLFRQTAEILREKAGDSDMVSTFYDLEEDSLDVLFLGSSHAYSAIQSNYLWGDYGIASYVMGSQRQTSATSYYLLLDALRYQKPEIVVLETYYFFYKDTYVEEGSLRNALDSMPFGEAKIRAIGDLLSDLPLSDRLSWYFPFLKYHSRWSELKSYDFHNKAYLKGGLQNYTVTAVEEPLLTGIAVEVPEVSMEYFEKIIALCEENQIELVLFSAPYSYEDGDTASFEKKTGMQYTIREYAEEHGIPFLWYQDGNPAGIDYATDFRDWAHLNTYGAKKLTEHLGAYLTENYDLPDHRGDEDYRSWEEDYATFMEQEAELTAG